jgi:glutathione S-transferase
MAKRFGGQVSEGTKERVRKNLSKGIAGFAKLAQFSPYVAGDSLTLADCAVAFHLPIAVNACKLVLAEDLLAELPVKAYGQTMAENPHMQKVLADRKENAALMASLTAKKA